MTAIVSFIGWQDSGKTTLAEHVIKSLKERGYRVAAIKSSGGHGPAADTPGTDTDRHRRAGADPVMLLAPDEMVLRGACPDHGLGAVVHRYFHDVDIVIAEGFKYERQLAKIEVVRDPAQCLRREVSGVVAVATDLEIAADHVFCLDEWDEIASFIAKRFLQEGSRERVSMLVNGRKIPLRGFIQDSLAGTVAGYVNSLKLPENGAEIELKIKC